MPRTALGVVTHWVATSVLAGKFLFGASAAATCLTLGLATNCDTAAPAPWTTQVGEGNAGAADNRAVILAAGSQIAVGNSNAIALRDNAVITLGSNAIVSAKATNAVGAFTTGGDTIDTRNNGTITVAAGAQILALGTQGSAEAINFQGPGNTLINNGTVRALNAVAIWSQNTSGLNTIVNNVTGVIQAPGTVIGGSGNGALDFTNKGMVIGNLLLAGGNDTLRLYTGSTITGNFSGGAGTDTIYLSGDGAASLPGNMVGFESLIKTDPGTWTLTGSVTGVTVSEVQAGTLALTGNNAQYTGRVLVDPAGTLEARAQSLPPTVTDNGLVLFQQTDDGTYSGLLSGVGAVEKNGAGTLTLAPSAATGNTYSGGTTLDQGVLSVAADSALGAASGGIIFNGGTLQLGSSFDLAATRSVVIQAPGGAIDTQGFDSTLAQAASGEGGLTKSGTGVLIMTGNNTYTGGTTIAQGTLQLGNGGSSGSVVGDVSNNGVLVFNRADALTYSGVISGSGNVVQSGSGSTLLTANSPFTGGTQVTAGVLAVGDAAHGEAALSGGGPVSVAQGATLGGYGSVTGPVDNNGSVAAANALGLFSDGVAGNFTVNGNLTNSAQVQLAGNIVGNTLTVAGNYVGQNGVIALNTYLGSDNSASDRLVLKGGTASGNTALQVTNAAGPGAATYSDGIQVVAGQNGASSSATAFTLAAPVAAGAHEYVLFRGGVSSGTADSWYLRSSLPPPLARSFPVSPPATASAPEPEPEPAPGSPVLPITTVAQPVPVAPNPGATPVQPAIVRVVTPATTPGAPAVATLVAQPVQLYRVEVPVYSVIPENFRALALTTLGTFDERRGQQSLLAAHGGDSAVWGRVFGEHVEKNWGGTVAPSLDGSIWGTQVGVDLWRQANDTAGVFFGYATLSGDIKGQALGWNDLDVGSTRTNATSLGAYWTHVGPSQWYVDSVLMGTHFDGSATSERHVGIDTNGHAVTASVEAGYPLHLTGNWVVEPQAQVIWQQLFIDSQRDSYSTVQFNTRQSWTGRVGVRVHGEIQGSGAKLQPFLAANVWDTRHGSDQATFGDEPIGTDLGGTSLDLSLGVVAAVNRATNLYVSVGRAQQLDSDRLREVTGTFGVEVTW
ncbi:autotransporter domain-containing protein [Pseudomonas sp.]|uniref:autotransporter family protein n=1 Tax=Pseudomonas sp. TaxID=306 RepID=UPI003CC55034